MAVDSTSSARDSHPAWTRWVVPSVGDLLFVVFLVLLAFTNLSVRLLGDAGIGWHIRTGQLILATHAIPRVDPFSSSMSGQPWFAWEWLYDLLVGRIESAAGLNGVVLLTAVIIAVVFSWTFRLLLHRGANVLVALVLVLLAASSSMIHFLARPHVISWLFTVAWFWVLESSREHADGPHPDSRTDSAIQERRLWFLPLLMLVWVNVHGGFLVGFVLLAISWFSAAWRWSRLALSLTENQFADVLLRIRAGRRLRTLTWSGILCAIATSANPYGVRLHVHIYRYLSNRFLMDHIDEFQSPNFHYVAQKCFAGLLLLTLVALAAKGREARSSDLLVVLFAAFSGLWASRNIPVSSLLLILVIGPWVSHALGISARMTVGRRTAVSPSKPFLHRMKAIESNLRGQLWPIAATALACYIAFHGGRLGEKPLMDAHFDARRFPVAAVNDLEKQDVRGPILAPDYWGGYFIYRLYPRVKVVVDDRHDLFGEEFLKSYLKMVHVEPGWEDFLRQHPSNLAVVPKESALANILSESTGWKAIYGDDVATVFVNAGEKRH